MTPTPGRPVRPPSEAMLTICPEPRLLIAGTTALQAELSNVISRRRFQELVAEAIAAVGGDLISCLEEVEEPADAGYLSLIFRRIEEADRADNLISMAGGIPNA